MRANPAVVVFALLAVFAAGCQSAGPAPGELTCTLVYLKTGTKRDLTDSERQTVFAGHFANMGRLAREGQLLVAGPFGQTRHDPELRGIFILDAADRERARQLAETDPGFRAGVFALEYHDLVTRAPLRALLAAELEFQAQVEREGRKPEPGEGGRSYVLLTAENGAAARAALADHRAVLLCGRLDGSRAFAVLDAKDPADVPALLGAAAARIGPHVLDAWFATGRLARLPELAGR